MRGVSDETVTALNDRAARSGRSLRACLLQPLTGEGALLTPGEAAEQARAIAARGHVTADDIPDAVGDMREARG